MTEILINKFFGYTSGLFITLGIVFNITDVKGWILFLLSILLVALRFIATTMQIKKSIYGEIKIKKTIEYRILVFLKIVKEKNDV